MPTSGQGTPITIHCPHGAPKRSPRPCARCGIVPVSVSLIPMGEALATAAVDDPAGLARDRQLEVLVSATSVALPGCPNWSGDPGYDPRNEPLSNLGCANVDSTQPVFEVLLLLEGLAGFAVPPLVKALVDVPTLPNPLNERDDSRPVARLRRTDEVIKGNIQPRPDITKHLLHLVAVRERLEAQLFRAAEHVLREFVVSHQEMRRDSAQTFVAGDHVGRDLLVSRAEVRPAVDIVDGGCDVEAGHRSELGARLSMLYIAQAFRPATMALSRQT